MHFIATIWRGLKHAFVGAGGTGLTPLIAHWLGLVDIADLEQVAQAADTTFIAVHSTIAAVGGLIGAVHGIFTHVLKKNADQVAEVTLTASTPAVEGDVTGEAKRFE